MTQVQYMANLHHALKPLPEQRREEILEDIRLHFSEGLEQGVDEETLAEGLGDMNAMVREYRALYATERAQQNPSVGNYLRAIWAGIGMGLLNLIFVLPIAAAIFAVWIGLLVAGVSMALGGALAALITLLDMVFPMNFVLVLNPWINVFGGIALCCMGSLISIGMIVFGRWLGKGLISYIQVNIDIIAGRRKNREQQI